jgi:hypothetical protein
MQQGSEIQFAHVWLWHACEALVFCGYQKTMLIKIPTYAYTFGEDFTVKKIMPAEPLHLRKSSRSFSRCAPTAE